MPPELQEALTAANVTPLVQKQIDPMLLEYQRRYSPLVRSIPTKPWGSTRYNFNRRTQRGRGGFVTDGGARNVSASTYEQAGFEIKLMQTVGAITGFSQVVTRDLVGDLKQLEIDGSMQSLLWDIETALVWGNDPATAGGPYPQFSGLDYQVSSFSGSSQNAINLAGAALTLAHLDRLADLVEQNAAMPVYSAGFSYVMSPNANSKVAQLLQNQQRFLGQVEVAAGLLVPSYRDIPIVKSSFLAGRTQTMGAVTTATATAGGTLAAATYRYRVAAVLEHFGEQVGATSVTQTTTGAASTVTLSFATPSGPEGAGVLLYKVYRSTGGAGTESLLGVIDAVNDAKASILTIVDTGAKLTTATGAQANGPAAYVGTNADVQPRDANLEDVYLIPRTPDVLVRPYTRDITFVPLATTKDSPDELPYALLTDCTLAIRGPKYVGRLRGVVASL